MLMVRSLAVEFARHHVARTRSCPWIETDMTSD
jgi:hypothetical protein